MAAFCTDTTATSAYVMTVASAAASSYVVRVVQQEPLIAKDGRRLWNKEALKQHNNRLREKELRRERLKDLHQDPLLKQKALPPVPNSQSERQRQKQKRRARLQEELIGC